MTMAKVKIHEDVVNMGKSMIGVERTSKLGHKVLSLKRIKLQKPGNHEQGNKAEYYGRMQAKVVKENHREWTGRAWEMSRRRHEIINAPCLCAKSIR